MQCIIYSKEVRKISGDCSNSIINGAETERLSC